eukprot:GHVQ01023297.1.p1 GENE.GHVQ01023297.1~~GHVQ01023297.1.p1  ORF type:complete len:268 (+),score=18.17 GHVQ01023297.1:115-918(+)
MLITRNIPNFLSSTLHRSSRLPFYVVSTSSLRCYTTRDSYIFSHCYKQTITWTSSLPHLRLFSSIPSPTPRSDESHTLVSSVECCLPKLVADSPDDSYASFLVARCSEQALLNGKLDDFAYDPSWATDAVIQVLLYCTGTFGLSWSAAIMVVGVCIRALMLPILIGVERQKRRLAAVSPQINTIKEEIQQARSQSNTKKVADAQKRFTVSVDDLRRTCEMVLLTEHTEEVRCVPHVESSNCKYWDTVTTPRYILQRPQHSGYVPGKL